MVIMIVRCMAMAWIAGTGKYSTLESGTHFDRNAAGSRGWLDSW